MADLTQGALGGLLGTLTNIIKDEVKLKKGIKSDLQFIKDEMDSMNGFLLHLTKTATEHDDQHRAWMKQVRDIAYIAEDCIEKNRDLLHPPCPDCCCDCIGNVYYWQHCKRSHEFANDLQELKARVREVGERRLRYGVSVPNAKRKPDPASSKGGSNADENKEKFLIALDDGEVTHLSCPPGGASPSSSLKDSFKEAIDLLPLPESDKGTLRSILHDGAIGVESAKMLLRALYADPYVTTEDFEHLMEGGGAADERKKKKKEDVVMTFCYSRLPTNYKNCLLYLATCLKETRISRTILIRKWLAEGLVHKNEAREEESLEVVGERCFDELVFRGFIRPATATGTLVVTAAAAGLKIKSCYMEKSVREFVFSFSQSENFLSGGLPTHLKHQVRIRAIAQKQPPKQLKHQVSITGIAQKEPPKQQRRPWHICPWKQLLQDDDDKATKHPMPMDEIVRYLKALPPLYRLNVLDLGGCRGGLKKQHLKTICKVQSLKYLSLKNTDIDVSRLPKEINNLLQLETLDVRQTKIASVKNIELDKLKHLLGGHIPHYPVENENVDKLLQAVQMPHNIGPSMEVLRHVKISKRGQVDLGKIGRLTQLRKLGVVLDVSKDDNMTPYLVRTINMLSECLGSLSICIKPASSEPEMDASAIDLKGDDAAKTPPKDLESLNISYFRVAKSSSNGSLPPWIKELHQLSKVTLRGTRLPQDSLRTLGKLESLRFLRLHHGSYTDECLNMVAEEFPKLRLLLVDLDTANPNIKFSFTDGAAPKLEKIAWTLLEKTTITFERFSGLENLKSLKELELIGGGDLFCGGHSSPERTGGTNYTKILWPTTPFSSAPSQTGRIFDDDKQINMNDL